MPGTGRPYRTRQDPKCRPDRPCTGHAIQRRSRLNYCNVQPVARLSGVRELHIGHAIVSRATFVGLREAVREMKQLMREAADRGE